MYEGDQGMAKSESNLSPKEKSLVIKINNHTRELLEGLRSVEGFTKNINERLLPLMEKPVLKEGKCEQAPSGWFEEHLADLRVATHKVVKIIEKLNRLMWATKTEQK